MPATIDRDSFRSELRDELTREGLRGRERRRAVEKGAGSDIRAIREALQYAIRQLTGSIILELQRVHRSISLPVGTVTPPRQRPSGTPLFRRQRSVDFYQIVRHRAELPSHLTTWFGPFGLTRSATASRLQAIINSYTGAMNILDNPETMIERGSVESEPRVPRNARARATLDLHRRGDRTKRIRVYDLFFSPPWGESDAVHDTNVYRALLRCPAHEVLLVDRAARLVHEALHWQFMRGDHPESRPLDNPYAYQNYMIRTVCSS